MDQEEVGQELVSEVASLIADESNLIANLANTAAVLDQKLAQVNWVGFYLWRETELVLGPFQGKPACIRIKPGNGVCGTAVDKKQTIVVPNVHDFPNHIACDPASQSEIVVPIIIEDDVKGVLDIDSPVQNRFDDQDRKYLEEVVKLIIEKSNWTEL